jgi:hypothetical protein
MISHIKISRQWAMPNSSTFSIKPIEEFIFRIISEYKDKQTSYDNIKIIDPFCNGRTDIADINNDLDSSKNADYHMDALDFLKIFDTNSIDGVLFDPPYSPRQVSECYKSLGKTVNIQTTQSSFWSNMKKEIERITKIGGFCVTCGWNSGGIGKKYGFNIEEILLVPHGGWHNDTIITLEKKI